MSVWYELYAEAKIDGTWRGIDFYVRDKDGELVPVPLEEGKSVVGEALEYSGDCVISADELSPELRKDHADFFAAEEESAAFGWRMRPVSCVYGSTILSMDLERPEHCGFVDCESVRMHEQEDAAIEEWLTGRELAALPPEARRGYMWYEWTDAYSAVVTWLKIRRRLERRVAAYNDNHLGEGREIGIADCRVVVLCS